jgi:hypothetical protein
VKTEADPDSETLFCNTQTTMYEVWEKEIVSEHLKAGLRASVQTRDYRILSWNVNCLPQSKATCRWRAQLNYKFRSLHYTQFSRGGYNSLSVDKGLILERVIYLSQYVNNTQLPTYYITCNILPVRTTVYCTFCFHLFVSFFASFKMIRILLKWTPLYRTRQTEPNPRK